MTFFLKFDFEPAYDTATLPTALWFERFFAAAASPFLGHGAMVAMHRKGGRVVYGRAYEYQTPVLPVGRTVEGETIYQEGLVGRPAPFLGDKDARQPDA